ncbi:hypothetical protein M407DRAFT_23578 [Tulasnella calospora MUT 4182]|uniref:Pirin N-terminal domain-containing protein n=1 Tax=Tulasnella calospora MUT 4182 TaxID=1051891 RepID=A0A0C3QJB2_9AGAM|nr:hypothetical protein M407DRAFT_23578 [Tulasnella calospora MUT 4182]
MSAPGTNTEASTVKLIARRNEDRGGADHGWLKTLHTFSFADYYDPRFESYGCLRVINEDRVSPERGFGTHGHREMEIFSYVVSGELEHKDSMGNVEVLRRGDIQHTSAGTGIRHSEYNKPKATEPVHFLQIWAMPHTSDLEPKYFARHFTDEEKTDKLVTVVAPVGSEGVIHEREAKGPAPVQSNVTLKATIISPGKSVEHVFPAPAEGTAGRKGYIHVVQTSGYNTLQAKGNRVKVNDTLELAEGDGAFAVGQKDDKLVIENIGDSPAEVLVFDIQ